MQVLNIDFFIKNPNKTVNLDGNKAFENSSININIQSSGVKKMNFHKINPKLNASRK